LGTSFREVADRLNDYAHENQGEKLRVAVCGPPHTLIPFLDEGKFELVPQEAAKFTVVLNRTKCMPSSRERRMFTVRRGNAILAAVLRNERLAVVRTRAASAAGSHWPARAACSV
jgi:hypothetical protein